MPDDAKQRLCAIGPLPPPMNGNSKAFETLVKSPQCAERFDVRVVDLARLYCGHTGKLSLGKLKGFFKLKHVMRKICDENQTDVFYLTCSQTFVGCIRDIMIFSEISRQRKLRRLVVHLHGGGFRNFYCNTFPWLRWLIRKYYGQADIAIVLGASLRNMFEGIVPDNRIRVIPNCVDDAFLISDEELEHKLRGVSDKKMLDVLYLSSMVAPKGYLDLLTAAKECARLNLPLRFHFAGQFISDSERAAFLQAIRESGLQESVSYLGVVAGEEKRRLLCDSDIFALPTYYPNEGQPISILEAMNAGLAVLATRWAGIPDIMTERENGSFINPKDPQSITNALKEVCGNRAELARIMKRNHETVEKRFREERYIADIIQCLNQT